MKKHLLIIVACLLIVLIWGCDSDNNITNPDDSTAPAAISNLRVMGDVDSTCILTWTAPGDDGEVGTVSSYDIRYATDTATLLLWNEAVNVDKTYLPSSAGRLEILEVEGLIASGQYVFAVKSIDESGNISEISNIASEPLPNTPHVMITSPLMGEKISDKVIITAEASDNTGIAYLRFFANGYFVGMDSNPPFEAEFSAHWADHGQPHSFYAQAYDTEGNLGGSAVIYCQTDTTLFAPARSVIHDGYYVTDSSITIYWSRNTDIDFNKYYVNYDTLDFSNSESQFQSEWITDIDDTSLTIGNLQDTTRYYFQVVTQDEFNHSAESFVASAVTLNSPPEQLALSVRLTYDDSIILDWTPSTATDFYTYSIYRSSDEDVTQDDILLGSITNQEIVDFTDTTVDSGGVYYYAILEEDTYGFSTFSNVVQASAILRDFALEFNGEQLCVIPYYSELDVTTEFTIEAWVYPHGYYEYARIIEKTESECCFQYNLLLHLGHPGIDIGVEDTDYQRFNNVLLVPIHSWTHVAITFNNGSVRYYIDGEYKSTQESYISQMEPKMTQLNIGRRKLFNEFYYQGLIDEVRLWNVARSDTEVLDNYDKYLTGQETGLIGYWTFNEGQGQISRGIAGETCQLGSTLEEDFRDPEWVISTSPLVQ